MLGFCCGRSETKNLLTNIQLHRQIQLDDHITDTHTRSRTHTHRQTHKCWLLKKKKKRNECVGSFSAAQIKIDQQSE